MNEWQVLQQIKKKHILVVGDLILDKYTFGSASRVSPEAPVPVLLVEREESLPGGAGNVALNLLALGQNVSIMGRVGADSSGIQLRALLSSAGVNCDHLYTDVLQTPTKVRLIASSQQMVRIDYEEKVHALSESLKEKIIQVVPELFNHIDAIAISDYAKGFITDSLFKVLIEEAKRRQIPVITDPKSQNLAKYSGTTILKPNLQEARAAVQANLSADVQDIARSLFSKVDMSELIITRSEEGISLFKQSGEAHHYPVVKRQVRDVTGAGDTVLAILTAGIASSLQTERLIPLANIGASIAIERVGCASVTWDEIANRLFEVSRQEKVVQAAEFPMIKRAFTRKPVTLIEVDSSDVELLQLLRTIQQADRTSHIIAHVQESQLCSTTLQLLGSLEPVSCVIVGNPPCGPDHSQEDTLFSNLNIQSHFRL